MLRLLLCDLEPKIVYRAGAQDAPQEMKGKQATAELIAWAGCAWLHISFFPFPVGILHTSML